MFTIDNDIFNFLKELLKQGLSQRDKEDKSPS